MVTYELANNRELVRVRDNYTCQICGREDCRLESHHINISINDDSLTNLITLCVHCHRRLNFKAWLRDPKFLEKFNLKILNNLMDLIGTLEMMGSDTGEYETGTCTHRSY